MSSIVDILVAGSTSMCVCMQTVIGWGPCLESSSVFQAVKRVDWNVDVCVLYVIVGETKLVT